MGIFDSALDTRQRGERDYAAGSKRWRAEPARAAHLQVGRGSVYPVERTSSEGAPGRALLSCILLPENLDVVACVVPDDGVRRLIEPFGERSDFDIDPA